MYKVAETIMNTKPYLISKGFQKAGIYPWDPEAPNTKRMVPSQVYDKDKTVEVEAMTSKTLQTEMTPGPSTGHRQPKGGSSAGIVSLEAMDFAELSQEQQIEMEVFGATWSVDSAVTLPILETGQVTTSTFLMQTQDFWQSLSSF